MNFLGLYRTSLLAVCCLVGTTAMAQPAKRRADQTTAATKTAAGGSYREFPVAETMPEDVTWRRDIYRTLDLAKDANATLYYPITPQGSRMSLFTYLFKLILRGQIKAYSYNPNSDEDFSAANAVKAKELMDRYHIYYESKDGRMRVNDADIPSEDVRQYYIKESTFYDQNTATFRTQVTALCPVLRRGGELGEAAPLFWVRYADAAPFLGKLMLMASNLNNASILSADDYFTQNLYKGDIYKAVNLQNNYLVEDGVNDKTVKAERQLIEKQLTDFEAKMWQGDSVKAVAADSAALAAKAEKKTSRTRTTVSRRSSATTAKVPAAAAKRQRSASSYSVRRERH